MPANYTITYYGDTNHDPNATGVDTNTVTFSLIGGGLVEYAHASGSAREVDLITLYFTKEAGGDYPAVPDTFILKLNYSYGHAVKPIYKDVPAHSPSLVEADDERGQWTLTITAPTVDDEITNFQLYTDYETPSNKLKIRVKRQPSFTAAAGPFDDIHGGELP